jgi:hypothetical protein
LRPIFALFAATLSLAADPVFAAAPADSPTGPSAPAVSAPSATALAAGAPVRRFVFALRIASGAVGFIDVASVHVVGALHEADALLVTVPAPPRGQPSHVLARISVDCDKGSTHFLGGRVMDADDHQIDEITEANETLPPLDTVTRALVCGGPGAPSDPRMFPTPAAAAEWARTGGI